ncbi:MAG: sugar phosphate isomerase/epimerase [Armatimonadetes bacterium]|nr:sugar phosphate isomerase/epimerase [Armatimonadota bacterium]
MEPTLAAYNLCDQDFDAFLANAATAGFRHVALGFFRGYLDHDLCSLTDHEVAALQAKLAAHGLKPIAVFAGGLDLLADGGLDNAYRALENTARLGIATFDMGSFAYGDLTPQERAVREGLFVDRVRRAGDRAGELGLTICLETHGGFTGDTDACLHAMEVISHPHVKLAYDPANFLFYEGRQPEDRLESLVPFIGHTHLKDHLGAKGNPEFPLIGHGQTNYEVILPTLWSGGYRGAYTLERAPGEDNAARAAALAEAYEFIRRLLPDQ